MIVSNVCYSLKYVALFCVEPHLMRLAVTMFILGVGTSPGGKARVGKSNTMNAGVGGGRPLTSPAPGSVGRRSTISYDQAKTSSSSTERTNEVPRYSGIQFYLLKIRNLSMRENNRVYKYNLRNAGLEKERENVRKNNRDSLGYVPR